VRITQSRQKVTVDDLSFEIARSTGGVIEIWGQTDHELATGLGFAHAHDRCVQMMLARLAGQGRLSECLKADEEMITVDIFMRQLGIARTAGHDAEACLTAARQLAEAYAQGVNACLERQRRPFELLLLGYRPEPWTVADTLLTIKLMSYVGLGQAQQDLEKLIIQAIHGGVSVAKLKKLFKPHLDDLDEELVEWIKRLRIEAPLLPPEVRFLSALPRMMASNNWAVAGSRSRSGTPLQCNDPHLECNRLPAVWYEAIMHTTDDYRMGATMPGVPGLVMGRTRELSFGFTYGFMDMVDYYIEECKDGRLLHGDHARELEVRTETVRVRKGTPIELTIRENEHGVLEADPRQEQLADGVYLVRAWSGHRWGAEGTLEALAALPGTKTVVEAQQVLRQVTISCNWVLADRRGNIGYQQSGQLPVRRHSGLHPVLGWDSDYAWSGLAPAEQLHSLLNPAQGFIVTANNDLNPPDGPLVINSPMASYRADRITALLAEERLLGIDDMKEIQLDLYSLQAERLMELLRPHLPDTLFGRLLKGWDLKYQRSSRQASMFEAIYQALLRRVFGEGLLGEEAWDALLASTGVLTDFYGFFDRALLDDDEVTTWFGEEGRDAIVAAAVTEVMDDLQATTITPWGQYQRVMMSNLILGGKLPVWLGFDYGPIELAGGRATVVQGAVYTANDRVTTFCPSWRYHTDLGTDQIETVLAGGPSGRRFSPHYRTDIKLWLAGGYKQLGA
jgi:penicillin amidase